MLCKPQLRDDLAGQNVRQTVFIECSAMNRANGPEEFRVVGETEWVQGIAAQSASGTFGDLRAAAGIVGSADLRLGERIAPVLEAQIIASSPLGINGVATAKGTAMLNTIAVARIGASLCLWDRRSVSHVPNTTPIGQAMK